MKVFQCTQCNFPVFFENTSCENCGSVLGYSDIENTMVANNAEEIQWLVNGNTFQYCKNQELHTCNWLVPINHPTGFCTSCQLNRTVPNLSIAEHHDRWKNLEVAKHRLIYELERLNLPLISKDIEPETGLAFDFLSQDVAKENGKKVMTGHANGVVTILLSEADLVTREKIRESLNENYRTLIGHFRHEVGHYYWDVIIKDNPQFLSDFRAVFGDESQDYGEALKVHYANGAPADWKTDFISTYASSHPWEDWAETWAHYLHILDTLETAFYFGLQTNPNLHNVPHMKIETCNPYENNISFKTILNAVSPLFFAVNSINRSMGITDAYPFVISSKVEEKLTFIHTILQKYKSRN